MLERKREAQRERGIDSEGVKGEERGCRIFLSYTIIPNYLDVEFYDT